MPQFTQPVSMQVIKEQYDKDLKEPLKLLGYSFNQTSLGSHLVTSYGSSNHKIGFTDSVHDFNGYLIEQYIPELFLAIAAMTNEQYGIGGEHWKCIGKENSNCFTVNKIYTALSSMNEVGCFVDDYSHRNGFFDRNINNFIKATKEELINLFTKKETIMTKVNRTISIKCANQEEFEIVKQWLRDNEQSVSVHCTTSPYNKCLVIYFNEVSERWNSGNIANTYNNIKTPQELGIINNSQLNNMQTEFPEKWAIKLSQEVKDWIVSEFKSTLYKDDYESTYFHFPNYGMYTPAFKPSYHTSCEIKQHYTEITLQQFKDNILNKAIMQNSLTRIDLIKLHQQFTCTTFRLVIEEILSTNILASDNTIFYISDNAIERLKKEGTPAQKDAVTKLGIVLEEDKSINLSNSNLYNKRLENKELCYIDVRTNEEFANISFVLNSLVNWEIKKDSKGTLCLIPTKK